MREATRARIGALVAGFLAIGCVADAAPSMSSVVQTFAYNQPAFTASVAAIESIESQENRLEISQGNAAAQDSRVADLFSIQPVSVKNIISYPSSDIIDYVLFDAGLLVGGKSWSIIYGGSSKVANDPAIASFPTCDGVDLEAEVEEEPMVLSAECPLGAGWILEYTAN